MKRALSQALRVSSTIASRGVGSIALRARVAAAHEQQESKLPLASLSFRRTFSTATEPKEAEVVDLKENGVEKELTPEEAEAALRDFEDEKSFDFNDMNLGGFNRPAAPSGEVREDIKVDAKTEKIKGSTVSKTFQTETRQILDIVTNSLYTDKEVFLRELISNASDALEKGRFYKTKDELVDPEVPFEVRIFTDENAKTITIQDTGVGMTGEELVSLLGTIARSGSKQWTKEKAGSSDASNIIGQFGVGFYSAFMVGDKVEVFTRSAKVDKDGKSAPGQYWVSDGSGAYEIAEAEGVERGTKVVIHLKPDNTSYSVPHKIDTVIKKYSNFVGFPIYLNGERLNTIQAIWTMPKDQITEEQHNEFYRYFSGAYDTPTYRMHFVTDAPIQINALFYFPERHMEKFGMGRMEPGVSLYSRKVLIQPKSKGLLPEYFRFVRGVVDSEDVPLNISRENMQDSLLISRMSSVLTKRIIRHLLDEDRKDSAKYLNWYNEFSSFIKEGVCSDFTHKLDLAKLLRFETSVEKPGMLVSLDEYISRMPPTQQNVYYLCAPNRAIAESSPYYEGLKAAGTEVLFLFHPMDEFVMTTLREYGKRKLVSAEKSEDKKEDAATKKAREESSSDLIAYVKSVLGSRVSNVTVSTRVSSYPAIVVDHESASVRKLMRMMDANNAFEGAGAGAVSKHKLEVNPSHPIFVKLMQVKDSQPALAKMAVEQVFDNALLAADILDNPRSMLPRVFSIIETALETPASSSSSDTKAEKK